jgi:putative membrane protein (TIGR04086 family)
MQEREGIRGASFQGVIIALLFGGIMALVICFLLSFLSSIMLVTGVIPERTMPSLCIIFCGISSLIGGHFSIKKGGGPPIVLGLVCGAFVCLLILLIGFCVFPQATLQGTSLWILLAALVGGGIAGLSKPKNKRKKRRK